MDNLDKFSNQKLMADFAPLLLKEINLELSINEFWLLPQLTKIIYMFKDTPLITKEYIEILHNFFNVTIILIIVFLKFFQEY